MKIEVNGYFDHNLGDDLMIRQAMDKISGAFLKGGGERADLKLTVSGSCFLVPDNKALMYRIREVYFNKPKCPWVVLGCNISPFINRLSERVIKKQISMAKLITVRDSFSYEYIKANVKNVRCEFFPDMVFAATTPEKTDEGFLGITAYGGAGDARAEKFSRVADRYIEKYGKGVILFAFDTGGEDDLSAAKEIYRLCAHKEAVKISAYTSDTDSVLRDIAKCSKMIAVRHHGTVLALKMGIGVVPVIYSEKTAHMLDDLNFSDRVFDFFSFDENEVFKSLDNTSYKLSESVTEEAKKHMELFLDKSRIFNSRL